VNKVNGLTVRELTASSWDGRSGSVVLLPLGSLEQHGPHLPIATDTIIAESVSQLAAAQSSGRAVVAPSVPYGVSYHHRHLPGAAVSLPASMLAELLVEIIDGLMGPKRDRAVIIVNGHGGNKSAMGQAIDEIGRLIGRHSVTPTSFRRRTSLHHFRCRDGWTARFITPPVSLTWRARVLVSWGNAC
jgi:creatinine amidohydrolase/Fe(II)-dependent formamide hydrolase-like protein